MTDLFKKYRRLAGGAILLAFAAFQAKGQDLSPTDTTNLTQKRNIFTKIGDYFKDLDLINI